jgi:diguanylate cyclase (GGDEF)-like protein
MLFFIVFLFSASKAYFVNEVELMHESWQDYRIQASQKHRSFSMLSASIGYGGMIHNFKDYVLQKDPASLSRLQRSFGTVDHVINQYHFLISTPNEVSALDDVQEMVQNYQAKVDLITQLIQQGKSSADIDASIRVEDAYAARALDYLQPEIDDRNSYYQVQLKKSSLVSSIRNHFGYTKLIHAFKNYIIRQEKRYLDETLEAVAQIEQDIEQYYQLETSTGEKKLLSDVKFVLEQYKEQVPIIKNLIEQNTSPEEINSIVRIDDKIALRGLDTLEQDIDLQIENLSDILNSKISSVVVSQRRYSVYVIVLMLSFALLLYWFISKQVIYPVRLISEAMLKLADGEADVDIFRPVEKKTELNDMVNALGIFSENEKKRRESELEIRKLAMTDPLTGLANRNQLNRRYKELSALAKRENKIIALLALDLDRFKPINDTHGHDAGDELLKNIAKTLTLTMRETDVVARTGGDEFIILMYGPNDLPAVENTAQRIIDLVAAPIVIDDRTLNIGVSIGVTLQQPSEDQGIEIAMKKSDTALYKAKESGRNKYCISHQEKPLSQVSAGPV